jgi:hypothetical protein
MSCGCDTGHDCGCHSNTMSHYPGGGRYRSPSSLGVYRRLRGLGAITASAAQAQIVGSDSHVNASSKAAILASAGALQMLDASGQPAYIPGSVDCKAAQGIPTGAQTDLRIGQTASGLALTGVNIGLMATGTALGPVTAGISIAVSSIIGLFSTLVNHHAQAVKTEQTVLCSAVPAANNYLNIISQAISSGQATPQDGINALESLKGDFRSAVGSIYNDCNAACVMNMELDAIILVMESQFQDMINSASAATAAAAAAPAAPAQVVPAAPNTTIPATGAPVPSSSYSSFYSAATTPGTALPVTTTAPNTVAAPTSSVPSFTTAAVPAAAAPTAASIESWLPIAAIGIGAILLLRSL